MIGDIEELIVVLSNSNIAEFEYRFGTLTKEYVRSLISPLNLFRNLKFYNYLKFNDKNKHNKIQQKLNITIHIMSGIIIN